MLIFAAGEKMGLMDKERESPLTSQYYKKYIRNITDIQMKRAWKTQGSGAKFMGVHDPLIKSPDQALAEVNGLTFAQGGEMIYYSITVDDYSGIFLKNPQDDQEPEGHVIHNSGLRFFGIDYCQTKNKLITAVSEGSIECHLAIFNTGRAAYQLLTEGESIDANPSWSKTDGNAIFYDTCGIAFNRGIPVDFSFRSICRLDLDTGEVREVIAIDKFDCIKPREDHEGNLYFIRKPRQAGKPRTSVVKTLVMAPVLLVKALFGWLNLFTVRYTGKSMTEAGLNPAKSKERNPEEVFIEGNLINASKGLKESQASGDKFPGIAPKDWELVRLARSGEQTCIKKGVLDYDITRDGLVVFSNGKYLVRINSSGTEERLGEVALVTCLRAW